MAQGPSSPASAPDATQPVDATANTCKEKRVIVIDPGHGGAKNVAGSNANNATSASGVKEKVLTLAYAQDLKEHLESDEIQQIFRGRGYCEVKIIMTRTTDVNVTARNRVKTATDNKADILMSIHFNGSKYHNARGTETFYRDPRNGSQANLGEDKALAEAVNNAAFQAISAMDSAASNRGIKSDKQGKNPGISVLRDPGRGLSGKICRSCLLEVEFIDFPAVDVLLVSGPQATNNRSAIMRAVARALANVL